MTEKRLIQGDYSTRRYLYSDEVFRKERNWNINLPSEREFKNGYCIATDKEDTAYSIDELVDLLNELHEENQTLQRHIKRSTFNKIRVEDVFNCAKYDKFYDNEEAIKSIDWIAKELGVNFE